jgi:hypothetical protein
MTQPFHFSDGQVANDAKDLIELCQQYPDDATGFLVRQDLEKWLAYIGSHDVAECAANARQIDVSDRQKLADFLNECHSLTAEGGDRDAQANSLGQALAFEARERMTSPQPVPPDVSETAIANKIETIVEETLPEPASVAPLTEAPQAPTIPDPLPDLPSEKTAVTPPTPANPTASTIPVLPVIPVAPIAQTAAAEKPAASPNSLPGEAPVSSNTANSNKPSFFQVVAKIIVQVLYRGKA